MLKVETDTRAGPALDEVIDEMMKEQADGEGKG